MRLNVPVLNVLASIGGGAGDAERVSVQQHLVNRPRTAVRGGPEVRDRNGDLAGGRHEPDVAAQQTAAEAAV